ncbi:MAG: hypothetical protein WDN48_04705 [Pseudolabrys sp.]
MTHTILITGFGPFPGAPFNPTGPLVKRLARRAHRARENRHAYFRNQLHRSRPRSAQAVEALQTGRRAYVRLASRARIIRIETRAQNALATLPDAAGKTPRRTAIAAGKPAAMPMALPAQLLLKAVRKTGVRTRLSRDAGRYLCNYLCWRATEAVTGKGGPRLAAFVHVPLVTKKPAKKTAENAKKLALDDLIPPALPRWSRWLATFRPESIPIYPGMPIRPRKRRTLIMLTIFAVFLAPILARPRSMPPAAPTLVARRRLVEHRRLAACTAIRAGAARRLHRHHRRLEGRVLGS